MGMLEGCQPELQRPQRCTEQSCRQGRTPSPALSIFNSFTGIPFYKVLCSPFWHQQPHITVPVFCEIRGQLEMTNSVSALCSLYFRVCNATNESQSLFRILQGLHIKNGPPGLQGSGMNHSTWNGSSGFSVLSRVDMDNKLNPSAEHFPKSLYFQKFQKFESSHEYNSLS